MLQICHEVSRDNSKFHLLWPGLKGFPLQTCLGAWPWPGGCALEVAEDTSHVTQCVPSNIFRSSGSPWIFLSKTTKEWQLAMTPHTGPQGRGVLDGNLWIFWNLVKSRMLVGLITRRMQRSPQQLIVMSLAWCKLTEKGRQRGWYRTA